MTLFTILVLPIQEWGCLSILFLIMNFSSGQNHWWSHFWNPAFIPALSIPPGLWSYPRVTGRSWSEIPLAKMKILVVSFPQKCPAGCAVWLTSLNVAEEHAGQSPFLLWVKDTVCPKHAPCHLPGGSRSCWAMSHHLSQEAYFKGIIKTYQTALPKPQWVTQQDSLCPGTVSGIHTPWSAGLLQCWTHTRRFLHSLGDKELRATPTAPPEHLSPCGSSWKFF